MGCGEHGGSETEVKPEEGLNPSPSKPCERISLPDGLRSPRSSRPDPSNEHFTMADGTPEKYQIPPLTYLNVTICMTQGPEEPNVAVTLLLPAVVTTLSSAMSPSGEVIIREVNPLPAAAFDVNTVFAPKISSLALVVVAEPLLAAVLFPLAPTFASSVVTPRYSSIRTSGNAAAWLNVTVTVLLPPAMLAA